MKRFSLSVFLYFIFSSLVHITFAQSTTKLTLVSGPGRGEEGAAMVCDGQFSTKWCIDSPRQLPYVIVLDAGQQMPLAEYGLVTGDDTDSYPERNPVTWRVSGSNDKQNWTTIDDRKNDRSLPADNYQEYRFAPSGKGQYRYFRFEFIRMAGGSRIQLSEIFLYKTKQMPIKATFSSGTGRDGKESCPRRRRTDTNLRIPLLYGRRYALLPRPQPRDVACERKQRQAKLDDARRTEEQSQPPRRERTGVPLQARRNRQLPLLPLRIHPHVCRHTPTAF